MELVTHGDKFTYYDALNVTTEHKHVRYTDESLLIFKCISVRDELNLAIRELFQRISVSIPSDLLALV